MKTPDEIRAANRIACAKYQAANKDKRRAYAIKYREANRDKLRALTKRWDAANRERRKAAKQRRKENNPTYASEWRKKNKGKCVQYTIKYHKKNPEKHRIHATANANKRRTIKDSLPWVSTKELTAFYVVAARVSKCTGIKFHVDHIMPLCGNGFCGLHVPWNLQVIPAKINLRKGNKTVFIIN